MPCYDPLWGDVNPEPCVGEEYWIPSNTGTPITTTPRTPQVIATQSGITAYPDKLSTVLSSILSGLALIKGAQHVPTTVSQQPTGIDPNTLALLQLQGNQQASGGNLGGSIQQLLENNTGAVLIGVVVLVAFLAKSPRK